MSLSLRNIEKILTEEFNSSLAWGMVYGPELTPSGQWDMMRDQMAAQFTKSVIDKIKKELINAN